VVLILISGCFVLIYSNCTTVFTHSLRSDELSCIVLLALVGGCSPMHLQGLYAALIDLYGRMKP